jgi:hypothetical protein
MTGLSLESRRQGASKCCAVSLPIYKQVTEVKSPITAHVPNIARSGFLAMKRWAPKATIGTYRTL